MAVKRNVKSKNVKHKMFWGHTKKQRRRLKAVLEYVALSELKLWKGNPRHNDEGVEDLANSIKKHGFNGAIIATPDGTIMAGNTRFKALTLLQDEPESTGGDTVRVHWKNFETEAMAHAFALSDNKLAEQSRWDRVKLGQMFKKGKKVDIEQLQQFSSFKAKEIDWALDNPAAAKVGEETYTLRIDNVLAGDYEEGMEIVQEVLEDSFDYVVKTF